MKDPLRAHSPEPSRRILNELLIASVTCGCITQIAWQPASTHRESPRGLSFIGPQLQRQRHRQRSQAWPFRRLWHRRPDNVRGAALGVNSDATFLTGNVGGGVKCYAPNSRWGLRGDYRFLMVKSNDSAPAFFGQSNRYAHSFYAGLIINTSR
jgi:hypothetical protein